VPNRKHNKLIIAREFFESAKVPAGTPRMLESPCSREMAGGVKAAKQALRGLMKQKLRDISCETIKASGEASPIKTMK